MARDRPTPNVKPVDDPSPAGNPAPEPDEAVVRLSPGPAAQPSRRMRGPAPVAPPAVGPEVSELAARLGAPSGGDVAAKRTHEPGIDHLIPDVTEEAASPESQWGEGAARRRPVPWGWFALIGLALAGAVAWSLWNVAKGTAKMEEARQKAARTAATDEVTNSELEKSIARMDEAVKRFCLASSVSELAAVSRQPERVRPLMEHYYADAPPKPLGYVRRSASEPSPLNSLWVVKVDTGGPAKKSLIVEQLPNGEYRVDWETAVIYQPMDWDAYATQRPRGSMTFRVTATPDDFYTHEFRDPKKWACYKLNAPGADETLWGYARKDGPEDELMAKITKAAGDKSAYLIAELSIPEGLHSRRGVVIEKVLSARWIYLVDPTAK